MKKIYLILALLIFPIILCGCGKKEIVQVERPKLKPIFEYKTVEEYANDVKKIADSYDNITIKGEIMNFNYYTKKNIPTKKLKKNEVYYYKDNNSDLIFNNLEKLETWSFVQYKKKDLMLTELEMFHHSCKKGEKCPEINKRRNIYKNNAKYEVYNNYSFRLFIDKLFRFSYEVPRFMYEKHDIDNAYQYFYDWYEYYKKIYLHQYNKFEPKLLGMTERNDFRCRLVDLGSNKKSYDDVSIIYTNHFICVNEEYGLIVDDELLTTKKHFNNDGTRKNSDRKFYSKITEINTNEIPNKKFKLPWNVIYDDESKNNEFFNYLIEKKMI